MAARLPRRGTHARDEGEFPRAEVHQCFSENTRYQGAPALPSFSFPSQTSADHTRPPLKPRPPWSLQSRKLLHHAGDECAMPKPPTGDGTTVYTNPRRSGDWGSGNGTGFSFLGTNKPSNACVGEGRGSTDLRTCSKMSRQIPSSWTLTAAYYSAGHFMIRHW